MVPWPPLAAAVLPGDPEEFAVPAVLVPGATGVFDAFPAPDGSLPNCSARRHWPGRTECCLRLGFRRLQRLHLAYRPLRLNPWKDRKPLLLLQPLLRWHRRLRRRPLRLRRRRHLGRDRASRLQSAGTRELRLTLSWT